MHHFCPFVCRTLDLSSARNILQLLAGSLGVKANKLDVEYKGRASRDN